MTLEEEVVEIREKLNEMQLTYDSTLLGVSVLMFASTLYNLMIKAGVRTSDDVIALFETVLNKTLDVSETERPTIVTDGQVTGRLQ